MKKNTLLAWGCGLLAACALPFSGRAVVIYDYNSSASASGFILNSAPTDVGDVGTLQTLSPGQFYQVTSIVVARVNGTTAGSFDIGFFLWGNVDTANGTSIFSNLLTSTSFNRTTTGTQSAITTTITVTPGALNLASGLTFGYQMEYAAPGTINLATAAYTPTTTGSTAFLINQGSSPNSGTSPDTIYVDSNTDGKFTSADQTALSGTGTAGFSNVYLVINANIVPEPGTNLALAVGGLVLLGGWQARRRRARAQS
ncbi:MAG: PEP-CTERM sorting domain-containing protein [Verrucomicrobia bacterium]|nr:PEP-CTERM sorting domain-containing protein [Verrucomicrobiota bacterium]MBV9657586.1 PEP-CTERM sorting domain-containing protein [Verrucomicrobiota bacterium]